MNIWIKSLLIGLAAAALTFFISKQLGRQNGRLYTIRYTLQFTPDEKIGEGPKVDAALALPQILKRRGEAAGYAIEIKGGNNNQLQIEVAHVRDTLQADYLLTRNSKLEFRELYSVSQLFSSISSAVTKSKKIFRDDNVKDSSNVFDTKDIPSLIAFSIDQSGMPVDDGTIGRVLKKDTAFVNKVLSDTAVLKSFPWDIEFLYGPVESTAGAKDKQLFFYLYAIKTNKENAPFKNIDIISARADKNFSGQPEVIFQFSGAGARIWERMTMENKGRNIAIILDKKVISAPRVVDVISGGSVSISGGLTEEETESLARQLNAGFIPVDLSIIEKHISPGKAGFTPKSMLMPAVIFVLGGGLSFLIFNSLKRK